MLYSEYSRPNGVAAINSHVIVGVFDRGTAFEHDAWIMCNKYIRIESWMFETTMEGEELLPPDVIHHLIPASS